MESYRRGEVLPTHAIYPQQKRSVSYTIAVIVIKVFKAFGIYLMYDLLKLIHYVPFLFFIKFGSAIGYLLLQRPNLKGLHRSHFIRIIRHSVVNCLLNLLWLFGLTLCGPFRTILLYEHNPLVVIAVASSIFKSVGGPSKFRGAVFFLISIFSIILFDHDDYDKHGEAYHPEGEHDGYIKHTFYHLISLSGLSDHKGGVILLVGVSMANVIFQNQSKKLSVDVGGAKRLQSLSTAFSAIIMLPWVVFLYFANTEQDDIDLSFSNGVVPFSIIILSVFLLDYYVESIAMTNMDGNTLARLNGFTLFITGFLLSIVWNHPFISTLTSLSRYKQLITEDHLLSGGVIFSLVLMCFATVVLTSSLKRVGSTIIGYSSDGTPLFSQLDREEGGHSICDVLRGLLKHVLEDSNSRSIFYFLCLNLSFTFVELIYGAWTNSLGLISDGFHMLFDCSALVMGLYAAVMSRWTANKVYSYGYARVEVLSGFVNGLFLVVVSFFILLTSITRIAHPPEINTDKLLTVSVLGLIVNLFGMFAFSHAHSHGGASEPSHGHSHGGHNHSHAETTHAHSHDIKNTNMRGVFLHVLADTLGSVGVIISTLLIEYFGWNIADPICSLFIGLLIFASVIPLLTDTANVLLLRMPKEFQLEISQILQKVLALDGVLSYRDQHFWRQSGNEVCGTLHIQISNTASEQHVITQATSLFKSIGIKSITIQAEKESFYDHMNGLTSGYSLHNSFQDFTQRTPEANIKSV